MPLTLVPPIVSPGVRSLRERRLRRGSLRDRGRSLTIGLVNNMPDAAMLGTQRQFEALLADGAGEFDVSLTLWTLDSVSRSPQTKREIETRYRAAKALYGEPPDALILTGAEPRAASLEDEPYWSELTGLVDWAREHTLSTMASCLAAHVVVQHQHGVRRRRLPAKRSGIYASEIGSAHPLTHGTPRVVGVPHSRWNDLGEEELAASGYQILRRSTEAGVDVFVKEGSHLQVFLQGHPEYAADTLAREYRRDVIRSLRAGSAMPPLPAHYFSQETEAALRASPFSEADFPAQALHEREAPWRASATILFRNWLSLIAERKAAARPVTSAGARWGG